MPPRVGSARSKSGKVLKGSFPPPRPGYDSSSAASEVPGFLQVAVRCRPLISNEVKRGQSCERLLVDDETNKVVVLPEPGSTGEWKEFRFDYVYKSDAKQEKMFTDLGQPAVEKAFAWYNSTIFAYGVTGSGKTHSMLGEEGDPSAQPESGLIPRVVKGVLEKAATVNSVPKSGASTEIMVCCTYIEIYQERLVDLLVAGDDKPGHMIGPTDQLRIRSHPDLGVYVQNALEEEVSTPEEVFQLMHNGNAKRRTGAHYLNERSSRSHAIFTIKVCEMVKAAGRRVLRRMSKINLVDLAGSERQKETHAEGVRLQESAAINKSLHTLQRVLVHLQSSSKHDDGALLKRSSNKKLTPATPIIPFRESKLTRILAESLTGGSFCIMLACIIANDALLGQTEGTLGYASNARRIKQVVRRNKRLERAEKVQREVESLQLQLEQAQAQSASNPEESRRATEVYEDKIGALMSYIDETTRAQHEAVELLQAERAALASHLTPPACLVLRLRALGAPCTPLLAELERDLRREEAEFHQQRSFVIALEQKLKELLEEAAEGQSATKTGDRERDLERVLVRLRAVQGESQSLKERKKRIADLYIRLQTATEEAEAWIAANPPAPPLTPKTPGSDSTRGDSLGDSTKTLILGTPDADDLPLTGSPVKTKPSSWLAGSRPSTGRGRDSGDLLMGLEPTEVDWYEEEICFQDMDRMSYAGDPTDRMSYAGDPGETAVMEVVAMLKGVKKHCDEGMQRLKAYELDEEMGEEEGGRGIAVYHLMALVNDLPKPDLTGSQEAPLEGSFRAGAGKSKGIDLTKSMGKARLAWGDTRAIDCVGYAVERLETTLAVASDHKAMTMERLLLENQQLKEELYRQQQLVLLRDRQLQEAQMMTEEANEAVDSAQAESNVLELRITAFERERVSLEQQVAAGAEDRSQLAAAAADREAELLAQVSALMAEKEELQRQAQGGTDPAVKPRRDIDLAEQADLLQKVERVAEKAGQRVAAAGLSKAEQSAKSILRSHESSYVLGAENLKTEAALMREATHNLNAAVKELKKPPAEPKSKTCTIS